MQKTVRAGVNTEWVNLDVAGSVMEAYVAAPDRPGAFPPVLVFMEIFGVNSHIRDVTERIAAEGYVAIAMNYYHRTTPNLELGYSEADVAEGRRHKDQVTWGGIMSDIWAATDYLKSRADVEPKNRFAAIGFCFGGHLAYIAATLHEVAVTASFYGGGIATSTPGGGDPTIAHTPAIQGEILCLFGTRDPLIPQEDTVAIETALREAEVKHQVVRYDADHGFFCDQRDSYDPAAAADAWERVKTLFAKLK